MVNARRAIEMAGASRYLLNTDTESLKKLQEEYENKANLIDLIRKTKSSQITQLGSILKSLREDYERLRVEMGKFNRTINKQTISNLTKLEIRLVPVDRLLSIIIRLVNASEMDLFADTSSQDNDAHELFEHVCKTGGSLELTDLFNINIVVQGPDGQEKTYNDLDTVASNGTTITAKALISMHLMNYLMKGRRQPVRIPYYLDEAADIDISNQRILIDQGLAMGFVPVLASVSAQENARYCVHLGDGKSSGRLYVDENDWFIIQENYAPGANLFGEAA